MSEAVQSSVQWPSRHWDQSSSSVRLLVQGKIRSFLNHHLAPSVTAASRTQGVETRGKVCVVCPGRWGCLLRIGTCSEPSRWGGGRLQREGTHVQKPGGQAGRAFVVGLAPNDSSGLGSAEGAGVNTCTPSRLSGAKSGQECGSPDSLSSALVHTLSPTGPSLV